MDPYYSAEQALQQELLPGETLLWAGQPSRKVIFHREDLYLIPFSLMWGGFAIFWESLALGIWSGNNPKPVSWIFILWGIPFVVIGQYMIWGRFIYQHWKKARTFYGITAKRVIVLDLGWKRRVNSGYIDQIPIINKTVRSDGVGTLVLGNPPLRYGRRSGFNFDTLTVNGVPTFTDIENAESVYAIVADQRDKLAGSAANAISQK